MRIVPVLPGQKDARVRDLADRRELTFADGTCLRTPILVPSFSSRIPRIDKVFHASQEFIDGPILISAFDVKRGYLNSPPEFGNAIFLDSGGYEASTDSDLSDVSSVRIEPPNWTEAEHREVLNAWTSQAPLVVISYDHPELRCPIAEQICSASKATLPPNALREILIKPETKSQNFIHLDSIKSNVHSLSGFDVIGITEKEIGNSVLQRMQNIAHMRFALDNAGIHSPIHVFGSLDTITTQFYFVAGADIFDGLTWLRYAFKEGRTLYRQDFGITDIGISMRFPLVEALCWSRNYQYMKEMELEMRRFLREHDFGVFRYNGELLKAAFQSLDLQER